MHSGLSALILKNTIPGIGTILIYSQITRYHLNDHESFGNKLTKVSICTLTAMISN